MIKGLLNFQVAVQISSVFVWVEGAQRFMGNSV